MKKNDVQIFQFIYFFDRERAASWESCNLIGSGSGQYFLPPDHGHGNQLRLAQSEVANWKSEVSKHDKNKNENKNKNKTKTWQQQKNKRWQKHDFFSFS